MSYATPPPPVQPVQPQKKSHTLRNVLLVLVLLTVLVVGGCFALVGAFFNEVDKAIDEGNNQKGGENNPINITGKVGKPFSIGDIDYLAGWTLKNDALDSASVEKLRATNNGDGDAYPSVTFEVWKGTEVLTSVDCGLIEEVKPGTTQPLDCIGDEPLPAKYQKLTVRNSE